MATDKEIIIVGRGPAGISAALYTLRAGIKTTIIGKDGGALMKAEEIENFYGFPQPVTGAQLAQNGIAQAKRLGAVFAEDEVVHLGFGEKLLVRTTKAEYEGDAVILATGATRKTPNIPGLAEYEGKGVSYCAVCDGFFYKGRDVAVLGAHDFAIHEGRELLGVANSVTMLTNGDTPAPHVPAEFKVITDKIESFTGGDALDTITFAGGATLQVAGVFVALGVAGSAELARKFGAATENGRIVVDEAMATNIPGLYAAGDCTGGLLQVAKAVYEGAQAGTSAVRYLREK